MTKGTAIFAAGCFWGVEAVFRKLKGVIDTEVGYTGGHTQNPTYQEVCTDTTGHAEAVKVTFDPEITTYEELLNTFWETHDPTTVNRQGPDVGSQYRSAIFYQDEQQRQTAEKSKIAHQKKLDRPIVTEVIPAATFYPAEDYHQRYFEKNGPTGCQL